MRCGMMATALLALCVTVSFGAEPLLPLDETTLPEDEVSTTPFDYDDETTPPDTTPAPLPSHTTPPPAPPDQVFHNSTPYHDRDQWVDSPLNATTSSSSVGMPIHPSTSSVARASVFRVSSVGAVCLMGIVAIFCGLALNAF